MFWTSEFLNVIELDYVYFIKMTGICYEVLNLYQFTYNYIT